MTDDEQAQAVMDGLAGYQRCPMCNGLMTRVLCEYPDCRLEVHWVCLNQVSHWQHRKPTEQPQPHR